MTSCNNYPSTSLQNVFCCHQECLVRLRWLKCHFCWSSSIDLIIIVHSLSQTNLHSQPIQWLSISTPPVHMFAALAINECLFSTLKGRFSNLSLSANGLDKTWRASLTTYIKILWYCQMGCQRRFGFRSSGYWYINNILRDRWIIFCICTVILDTK